MNTIQTMRATEIAAKLDAHQNVILKGVPGVGKTHLANETADFFLKGDTGALHAAGEDVPVVPYMNADCSRFRFFRRSKRKVFRTTFHQNTKYRDFVSGIVPSLGEPGSFIVQPGVLYEANEFAKQDDSAALLFIDELNRGPAVEAFGDSLSALEADKRLLSDATPGLNTAFFRILSPVTGIMQEYALSPDLYLLAAYNEADVSVAPLDVAFMRRWYPVELQPDYDMLDSIYDTSLLQNHSSTSDTSDVYRAAIKALRRVNELITIGKGPEFQIGHGILLPPPQDLSDVNTAKEYMTDRWRQIIFHIQEVFFGDPEALAVVLAANSDDSPFTLEDVTFGSSIQQVLRQEPITPQNIYSFLMALGAS